ncbi:methionyl-tRNA formyltransferase [Candidatus Daviesbacteria bacterium RIFCSPLOWO2_01_FULL_43_38]|uniref:Methionyl-tRNA formyltransferase n=2 Tax=Candidatus Daviesiibacteriota TaxID=1752718 RepID=A0A1F5K761_9BACT|nr:MAG: methionyl-tRNA formyltransferase [Candidatus Daviesbacteria bacterium RIFCSPHIGHO2_01_FULL_43_17]OGE36655.1 MAG: methionyl-tRNA formyltransferase [Candidatus Daviesbacteria bacterium RIFCSPHIGHO2_12_FULL_43_11]OGE63230.1 MAG: methionyl-tRNA formyltransferase [Candidatus Daviesbacteria bacterium RIFCSPLOWO2_01_FULL_43_38]
MEPRVIFFGTPDFVVPVVSALYEKDWLAGVVTAPDKKVGRKQILTSSPIKQWALKNQVPVLTADKFDQKIHSELTALNSTLFVIAAYGHLLPQFILDIPGCGSLNIHPSLLPRYRGPSPIQNAILAGDKTSGVSIIKMDEKMDHGPVLITKEISLSEQDTSETLSKKMFDVGADLLIKIIPDFITGKVKLKEQNHNQAFYTHIIKKEDGYFDINPPAGGPPSPEILDQIIRAYYPWPTAWTKWNNKIVKFLPGALVQMEGKKPMPLEDFLRGHPNFPIKNLL